LLKIADINPPYQLWRAVGVTSLESRQEL